MKFLKPQNTTYRLDQPPKIHGNAASGSLETKLTHPVDVKVPLAAGDFRPPCCNAVQVRTAVAVDLSVRGLTNEGTAPGRGPGETAEKQGRNNVFTHCHGSTNSIAPNVPI